MATTNVESGAATLAKYVCRESFAALPADVRRAAARQIMSSVGTMIGGSRSEPARIVRGVLSALGGEEQATVLSTGKRVPMLHAVCINGYMANALDYDDMFSGADFGGHPCSGIVPAALAVAEQLGSSGEELIAAVAAGFECAVRVGGAIAPSPERGNDVLPLATWQSLGAAAAAANLLRLDETKTTHAIALAAVLMPVPSGRKWGELRGDPGPVSWAKNGYGWASMGAVLAALFARDGYIGNPLVFEGPNGFWAMAGSDRSHPERLTAGLGKEYAILSDSIKAYPACWHAQSTLEALEQILKHDPIDPASVSRLTIEVCSHAVDVLSNVARMTPVGVPFSLAYLSSLMLHGVPLHNVPAAKLEDPSVRRVAEGARVCERPTPTPPKESPATVTVELKNGKRLSATVEIPTGDYRRPLSDAALHEKSTLLMQGVLEPSVVKRILADLPDLSSCSAVGKMVRQWYAH
ncbi:MAG: MmgE/PrpD family protein [Thermotogota bacterium]